MNPESTASIFRLQMDGKIQLWKNGRGVMQNIGRYEDGTVDRIIFGIDEQTHEHFFRVDRLTSARGKLIEPREPDIEEMINFQRATAKDYKGLLSELMRPDIRKRAQEEAKGCLYQAEAILGSNSYPEEAQAFIRQAIELYELAETI